MRRRTSDRRLSRRMTVAVAAAIVALIAGTGTVLADAGGWFSSSDNDWPYNSTGPAPVLATVGDISCQPGTPQESEKPTDTCDQGTGSTVRDAAQNATAGQVEAMKPALVAVLGDEQYQNGYYSDFENSYDKYWGAFKFLAAPLSGQPRVLRQPRADRRPRSRLLRLLQRHPAQRERLRGRPDDHQPEQRSRRHPAGPATRGAGR